MVYVYAGQLTQQMHVLLFHQKQQKQFNLSSEEFEGSQQPKNNSSIIISKPDKGNGVLLMNKIECVSKMHTVLQDKTKFKTVKTNTNEEKLRKFQTFLYRLKNKKLKKSKANCSKTGRLSKNTSDFCLKSDYVRACLHDRPQ